MTTPGALAAAPVAKSALDFNLFSRFATKELTHSGMWGWILQSLDDACPAEYHELRPAAAALLARIAATAFESPITVGRERKLPGTAGRVDIEAIDSRGRVVVIEAKVQSRPDVAQRRRYEAAYRAQGRDLAAIAIVSTRYDEAWDDDGLQHVGPSDLLDSLGAGSYHLDVMRQYVAWLEHEVARLRRDRAAAFGDDPAACTAALLSDAVQWSFMHRLGCAIGGPEVAALYSGVNRGGLPWTQLAFSPGGPPDFDALFYRLESFTNVAAEFTLRQYQNPVLPGKPERLTTLRRLFREAVEECGGHPAFDTAPARARLDVQEAKVAQMTTRGGRVALRVVVDHLPPIHAAFVRRLRAIGWPLGRWRPAAPAPRAALGAEAEGEL